MHRRRRPGAGSAGAARARSSSGCRTHHGVDVGRCGAATARRAPKMCTEWRRVVWTMNRSASQSRRLAARRGAVERAARQPGVPREAISGRCRARRPRSANAELMRLHVERARGRMCPKSSTATGDGRRVPRRVVTLADVAPGNAHLTVRDRNRLRARGTRKAAVGFSRPAGPRRGPGRAELVAVGRADAGLLRDFLDTGTRAVAPPRTPLALVDGGISSLPRATERTMNLGARAYRGGCEHYVSVFSEF